MQDHHFSNAIFRQDRESGYESERLNRMMLLRLLTSLCYKLDSHPKKLTHQKTPRKIGFFRVPQLPHILEKLDKMNIHEPFDNVDVLDDVNWLIEQKFFAIFGPDSDMNDLIIFIEDSPTEGSLKRAHCQYHDIFFWVDLPG